MRGRCRLSCRSRLSFCCDRSKRWRLQSCLQRRRGHQWCRTETGGAGTSQLISESRRRICRRTHPALFSWWRLHSRAIESTWWRLPTKSFARLLFPWYHL